MAKKDKKKKKGNIVTVDFTGVEAGQSVIPEGSYEVKVVEVEQKTSDDSGNDYLSFKFEVVSPEKYAGKVLYTNKSLTENSLWSLRSLLELMEIEIPDEPMDLDLDDLVDKVVGCEVQHETYNKKKRSTIVDFFEFTEDAADAEEEEVEEEDDSDKKKKKSKKKDEDEEEEETEEEEEEAPKKGKKDKKKKSKTFTSDEVKDMDEEALIEFNEEHELEVDFDDYKTLRRKAAAVIEALEEKGMLEAE